ncbi:DUF5069 domain-containing protein [Candidatus Nomurabacteria bacterium]|nr:DUF5069 domain-containing protein [Candidatus Nomurabacteria bacterium]
MNITHVPLISSGVAGPLGVLHLPRLWLKLSLESVDRLAFGYPGAGTGYDQMVIDGLGLDRNAVIGFIKDKKPTYPEFEKWIVLQPGVKLDELSVDGLNSAIRGYQHDDNDRKSILEANGLQDNESAPKDAVSLNNLDDWKEFYDAVLK